MVWGGNEGSICRRILVFVNDVPFFGRHPPGHQGMLPDLREKKRASSEWLWVACLFAGSLQIHSAAHMVWIITAEPYKWIQHGGGPTTVWSSLGLKLTVSHFSEKYWASFMWPDSVGAHENWRSPWWTVSDVKGASLWPGRCGAQHRYTVHLSVDETERGGTLPPGGRNEHCPPPPPPFR